MQPFTSSPRVVLKVNLVPRWNVSFLTFIFELLCRTPESKAKSASSMRLSVGLGQKQAGVGIGRDKVTVQVTLIFIYPVLMISFFII